MSARLSPVEGYRLWAPVWDDAASPLVSLETRHTEPHLRGLRGRRVVDAGCGTGRWMRRLEQEGASVLGFDLSPDMLRRGTAGHTAVADLRRLPLPASCADMVLCALALGHCPDAVNAALELCRLVRHGGTLLITDFHPEAAARGWRRTFRAGPKTWEVESFAYSPASIQEAAMNSGLLLTDRQEPCFGEPERVFFDRAGKPELFETVRHQPALLLMRFERP